MVNQVMHQRTINGLTISRLMLGTAQMGLKGYGVNNQAEHVNADELLSVCEQSGINCYDTAYEYGDAEIKLGHFFKEKTPPFIASKLKIDMNLISEQEIERQMVQKAEAILSRLQLRSIPALMVHNPEMVNKYGASISKVLTKLKKEGLIQRGGISLDAVPVDRYAAISEYIKDEIYEVVQAPLNIFDQRLIGCGALKDLQLENKIVVARSVYLQGLFFMNKDCVPSKLSGIAEYYLDQLKEIAEAESMSIAQLAFSYIRDMEGVFGLVIGAESKQQIEENLRLMNGPKLKDSTREHIERSFSDIPEILITPAMWR